MEQNLKDHFSIVDNFLQNRNIERNTRESSKSLSPEIQSTYKSNSKSFHSNSSPSEFKRLSTSSRNNDSISSVQISISNVDTCNLSEWGLPPIIYEKYKKKGITKMFPWQVECLTNQNILERNKNLVYSAPTSAGKTLVSEILMLKSVLEQKKKAIFILPFVSVVREKMFYFQDLLSDTGVRVEGFMGGMTPLGGFSSVNIAIATIEKANSLINRLLENGELFSLGIVVIDELHLLGDPSRGYLLELLLTKLKYAALKSEHVRVQLVGMSATLPNLSSLAKWLNAELYKTDFRPIPLKEHCKISDTLYDSQFQVIRTLSPIPELNDDVDNIFQLCLETLQDGHGTLIFCPTKNWCEKLALQIAGVFVKLGLSNSPFSAILREKLNTSLIMETLEQLKRCPAGLDNVLQNTVSFGVAFHHAGLTMDERDIIENGFKVGSLKVLTATSTLSSGVNLPARRVIIRSPIFYRNVLDTLVYKQMIGRAGRMGKDTAGESILICKPEEKAAAETLLSSSLDAIESCLEGSGRLLRTLLEAIASQMVRTIDDLQLYLNCTFAVSCDKNNLKDCVMEAIQFLKLNEFITFKNIDDESDFTHLEATPLGKACLAAAISPRDGLYLFEELQRARRCMALDTELHILYLVTPFDSGSQINQIDWMNYLDIWKNLEDCERRVGELVGVEEYHLIIAMKGKIPTGRKLNVYRRFFTALALYELVHEVSLNTVCKKYSTSRGLLQSLQQSSATLAGMVTQFCKELGWSCMELLLSQFQARLQFGVRHELLDLLRLSSLNGIRARSLYKEGIKTVADLASANERDIERALNKAIPFESAKFNIEDDQYNENLIEKRKMKNIFITGRDGLTAQQAASILIQEARDLIQNELGVQNVKWNNEPNSSLAEVSSTIFNENSPINEKNHQSPVTSQANKSVFTNKSRASYAEISTIIESYSGQSPKQSETEPKLNNPPIDESSGDDDLFNVNDNSRKPSNIEKSEENLSTLSQDQDLFSNSNSPQNLEERRVSQEIPRINIELVKETQLSSIHQASMRLSTLPTDVLKTFNEPSKSLLQSFQKSNSDSMELFMEEIPINAVNLENQQTNSRKNSLNDYFVSFGTPWHDDETCNSVNNELHHFVRIDERLNANDIKKKNDNESFLGPKESTCSNINRKSLRDSDLFNQVENTSKNEVSRKSSLFNDSFIDVAMCEILELNVLESDSEKCCTPSSNANEVKNSSNGIKKKLTTEIPQSKQPKNMSNYLSQTTWVDDWSFMNTAKTVENRTKTSTKNSTLMSKQESPVKTKTTNEIDKNGKLKFQLDNNVLESKSKSVVASSTIACTTNEHIATKRKLSEVSKAVNDTSSLSWHDTGESTVKKPKISLHDQENVCTNTSESSKQLSKSKKRKSRSSSEFEHNNRGLSESPKASKIMKTKRKSSLEIWNDDDIVDPSPGTSNPSRNDLLESPETKKISKDIDKKNTATTANQHDEEKKSNKVQRLKNPLQDLKSVMNQQCSTVNELSESSSVMTPTRKSIYLKTDEEKTEEDFNFEVINVIKLESSKSALKLFKNEIETQTEISMALACESNKSTVGIGTRIVRQETTEKIRSRRSGSYVCGDKKLSGVAFSWGLTAIYFMSLTKSPDDQVTIRERINTFTKILESNKIKIRCFASKEVYKVIYQHMEIIPKCNFVDPKVVYWLLNPDSVEKSFKNIAKEFFPKGNNILRECDASYGTISPGLNYKSSTSSYNRAVGEVVLTWYITDSLLKHVQSHNPVVLNTFEEIEMKVICILAQTELRGFGLNVAAFQNLRKIVQNEMNIIEQQAYTLAGRSFKFCSPKEVSEVLKLPKKGKISTGRSVLEKIDNPIANLIIMWRKLNTTETKVISPILQMVNDNQRVGGNYITHTATGRVSMHEPNVQCVPKDFTSYDKSKIFSLRTAFIPNNNNVLLSADYCQLELRIMAHFSKDPILCNAIRNDNVDIFKSIAAEWNNVSVEAVDTEMRTRTKHLCYGMIYGMGTKTLAETLKVTEAESTEFLENFMSTFKGIRKWLGCVIDKARTKGYVTTIMGRRRYLPALYSESQSEKSQAERQAVNTKVQGSAADITKKAMVLIEQSMRKSFPNANIILPDLYDSRNLRSSVTNCRGGYLVLQLHDELLYEIRADDLQIVATIVKRSMESACKLNVPLPVKVKVGPTWGDLEEYNKF